MPRKVVRKERGVFEKAPGSEIWWIRFKVDGVEHREKVGRRGDAIKLYGSRKGDVVRGVKMPANMEHKAVEKTRGGKVKERLFYPVWKSCRVRGFPTFPPLRRRLDDLSNRTCHLLTKQDICTC